VVLRTTNERGTLKMVLERPLRTGGGEKFMRSQQIPLRGLSKRRYIDG
jgi:hypothetical protein